MVNMTLRNIPEDIIDKIKILSVLERRSMNSEILVVLEKGLKEETMIDEQSEKIINPEIQIKIWENLCGKWKDKRSTEKIIDNIISTRSKGRKVEL
ncbi:MAG: Arc family DNA-binding protein [Candidatus Firestonebacteria bacterium]|nr:Arc family DNA-binding protein [Candidatus Firestonebacteria bacterium]